MSNKKLVIQFYSLVDSGVHPLDAFDILYIAKEFDTDDYYIIYQLASNLAKDVVNYPPELQQCLLYQ